MEGGTDHARTPAEQQPHGSSSKATGRGYWPQTGSHSARSAGGLALILSVGTAKCMLPLALQPWKMYLLKQTHCRQLQMK